MFSRILNLQTYKKFNEFLKSIFIKETVISSFFCHVIKCQKGKTIKMNTFIQKILVGTNPNSSFPYVPAGLPVWLRIKRETAFTSKQVKPASTAHFDRFSWIYFLFSLELFLQFSNLIVFQEVYFRRSMW